MDHPLKIAAESSGGVCLCCGESIKLLGNHQLLINFLQEKSERRRGFRCQNCKQMVCFECGGNGFRCDCGSNAWVALPYLKHPQGMHTGQTA